MIDIERVIDLVDTNGDESYETQIYNDGCVVCLESFDDENERCVLWRCGHKFHHKCVQDCLNYQIQHNTEISCSVCRSSLLTVDHPIYREVQEHVTPIQPEQPSYPTVGRIIFNIVMLSLLILVVMVVLVFLGLVIYYAIT